jgi:hypothetical protein
VEPATPQPAAPRPQQKAPPRPKQQATQPLQPPPSQFPFVR